MKPMLALEYDKQVSFPAFVQPKLDGVRLLTAKTGGRLTFLTRSGKDATASVHPRLVSLLQQRLPEGHVLDGELYDHDARNFQELTSRFKKPNGRYLTYHVFDMFVPRNPGLGFAERYALLQGLFPAVPKDLMVLVKTKKVATQGKLDEMHAKLSAKYEGTMIRQPGVPYAIGKRSSSLLKRKDFKAEEFKIVDAVAAKGAHEGAVVWVLKGPGNRSFQASMSVPLSVRRKMYKEKKKYIGKWLTVKFQELTRDGIPRFPVGVAVRDYE